MNIRRTLWIGVGLFLGLGVVTSNAGTLDHLLCYRSKDPLKLKDIPKILTEVSSGVAGARSAASPPASKYAGRLIPFRAANTPCRPNSAKGEASGVTSFTAALLPLA